VGEITPALQGFAQAMLEAMYDENGIGLAAPQVGRSIRLIVVDVTGEEDEPNPMILFNPEVVAKEGEGRAEEGCLSVPGVWAEVTRPETISVRAIDENGKPVLLENIGGMLARCIQHEIDHLDGVLFVDKISATDRTLNESKLKKLSREAKSAKVS
jgi:peptide deformylase